MSGACVGVRSRLRLRRRLEGIADFAVRVVETVGQDSADFCCGCRSVSIGQGRFGRGLWERGAKSEENEERLQKKVSAHRVSGAWGSSYAEARRESIGLWSHTLRWAAERREKRSHCYFGSCQMRNGDASCRDRKRFGFHS